MKAAYVILALAAAASAWKPVVTETTLTTFVTTTVCPVTTTKVEHGSTQIITFTTTSILTVTKCAGGCGEATVTLPPTKETVTSEVYITETTVCPVTETKTINGSTYTKTYTTTSEIVKTVPTTIVEYTTLPPQYTKVETWVYETSTSLCPITEIKTVGGSTITKVYTSTSLVVVKVPTTVKEYTTLAPVTSKVATWVYETSTSLCPVTETKTISGKPVEVVYTSTSLVVVKVPTTIVAYTTKLQTHYETTEVYTTESEFETFYTTVKAGSTIVHKETLTSTVKVTSAYTITSTIEPPTTKATVFVPITLETSVPYTEIITIPSEKTATEGGGTVYVTASIPVLSTISSPAPVTTIPAVTETIPAPAASTTPPAPISSNSAATNAPLGFVVAGAMALLAFA